MKTLSAPRKNVIRWNLAALAKQKKLSGSQIAFRLGLHKTTVCDWMRLNTLPNMEKQDQILKQLCTILDCNLSDLIEII